MSTPEERLRREIRDSGPIPFARFMEEALYGAGGYYARPDPPIGEAGDFVTGSSLSPLFGRATARLLAALDAPLGRAADHLEAGYGTGAHVAAVAASVDPAARRLFAWDRVARPLADGVRPLADLEELEAGELEGLVFSYELFDALPVHRLIGREEGGPGELWVGLSSDGAFEWVEGELSDPALAALAALPLAAGQVADLAPGWRPLYRRLAERLGRGLLVTFDYGYRSARLLDARVRRHGTLACHRGQRVHRNPFVDVGAQDLSAHVDFGALIAEGEAAGLTTWAFSRQAPWLAACGLLAGLADAEPRERVAVQQLMALEGMGHDIRVLVQSRGVDPGSLLDLGLLRSRAAAAGRER